MISASNNIMQLSNPEYLIYYENAKRYLKSEEEQNSDIDYFTPHGYTHSAAVEAIVNTMLKNCSNQSCYADTLHLTELEKFLLSASIWTHDLGMIAKIAKEYYDDCRDSYSIRKTRDDHDKISAWHLSKKYRQVFLGGCQNLDGEIEDEFKDKTMESYVHVINLIIKYHRRKTDIEECPDEIYLGEDQVRCRLLACFLRLGDTLNIDSSRYDSKRYDFLLYGDFDRESRLHWLKSCIISNIYLDAKNQQAIVNIHLPEISGCDKGKKGIDEQEKDDERNLKEMIKREIDEDLVAVRETFRRYSLPIYVKTGIVISRIPGFDKNMRSDIAGLLSDLDLKSSLTSTQVINESLASIYHLGNMNNYQYKKFYYQFDQLIRHLESVHEERPCHVGVTKIIDGTRAVFLGLPNKDSTEVQSSDVECAQKKLKILYNKIREMRKRAKEEILTSRNVRFLEDVQNIFLFGHSSAIRDLLKKHAEESNSNIWENDDIYVFECAGKRRFSAENCLEYSDGIYYASKIRDLGFKNVKIVPDVQFATILEKDAIYAEGKKDSTRISGSNSVLLFGANGIDTFLFETKISDKALKKITRRTLEIEICDSATSCQIDASKIKECEECTKNTIEELNEKIAIYNNHWGASLKPIDQSDPRFEEEPREKWTISDRWDDGTKERLKKYIIKKDGDILHVYIDSDCDTPFEICSSHIECLNKQEIPQSLKQEFREKGHPLSPHSRFEVDDVAHETWFILDNFSIMLREQKKIKIYKDYKPFQSINGKFLGCLKKVRYCDNKCGSDLDDCLKNELIAKLQISDDFKIDDFRIRMVDEDEWHLESDRAKFVLKDCSRIKVYESYCNIDGNDFCKMAENIPRADNNILEMLKDHLMKHLGEVSSPKSNETEPLKSILDINEAHNNHFIARCIESSGELSELEIYRKCKKLCIYRKCDGEQVLVDIIDDLSEDKYGLHDIPVKLYKELERKGLKMCPDAKIRRDASDVWSIDSNRLTLVHGKACLKAYKNSKPHINLSVEIKEGLPLLASNKIQHIRDLGENIIAELKKLMICMDARIIVIDDCHWRIEPGGYEIVYKKEHLSVYRESEAYCSLDKKFTKMLNNQTKSFRHTGLYAEQPNTRDIMKICDDWVPKKPDTELLCQGLADELIKNKIWISRSSTIRSHGKISSVEFQNDKTSSGNPNENVCGGSSENKDQEIICCQGIDRDMEFWTIDDIQKRLYKIQRERGKQGLSVYRLDKGPSGHTSGHLMLSQIAKKFKIPVIIIADSFKMGQIKWKLSEQRDGEWLTTQKNFSDDLKGKDGKCSRGANIKKINYREDRIPEELISRIISEEAPPIADIEDLSDEKPGR